VTYVSPMVRARAIVAGQVHVSRCQRHHATRMVHLHPMVIVDLEREEAPIHLFRWVAKVTKVSEQRRRTDLVIHLRRSIERPRNGWMDDWHCNAAMDAWDGVREEARKRGGIMAAVHEIPIEVYRAAIDAAKTRRTRGAEPEVSATETESAAECGEPADPEDELEEDEEEEEPISARQVLLLGRDHVLRLLSDAVRAALAAQDMEAADAANDAISRLCGGRAAVG
jgi:hypothetical protein